MRALTVYAGRRAFAHIRANGLQADDIGRVLGASGAAKWLAIAGLDKAVFAQWLPTSAREVQLYGTSVGAFKLAAAAHRDAQKTLENLARAYIAQSYPDEVDANAIAREMAPVLDAVTASDAADQVLTHQKFRLSVSAVRCVHEGLASDSVARQRRAMVGAFAHNLCTRERLGRYVERAVFMDPRVSECLTPSRAIAQQRIALSPENYRDALVASGSLPVYMHAVRNPPGARAGVYRDGGLLDYHPLPSVFETEQSVAPNLVLYPHFYPKLTEGWFDKFVPWRQVSPDSLADVVLVAPSDQYVASLPGGAIPDRRDFLRLRGRDALRQQRWSQALQRSELLGEQFLDMLSSGDIASQVRAIA